MISFVIRTVINAAALLLIAAVSGDAIKIEGYVAALVAAVVLGLANAIVKPILLGVAKAMTCVLSCLTLGLWSLILSWLINGVLFYAAGQFVPGFSVQGFWPALWGALALSIVNALATVLTSREKEDR